MTSDSGCKFNQQLVDELVQATLEVCVGFNREDTLLVLMNVLTDPEFGGRLSFMEKVAVKKAVREALSGKV